MSKKLLQITVLPQVKGEIEVEVETIITVEIVSAYQIAASDGEVCCWKLNPLYLTCFNFVDDFKTITLFRHNDLFTLEVDFINYEKDSRGDNISGTDYVHGESLEVSAVREVQDFPSVEDRK